MTRDLFFYGTLCHAPLLARVLGRDVPSRPARLADHAVHWAQGRSFPLIRPERGAEGTGVLVEGLTPADIARLDYYEGGLDFRLAPVTVTCGGHKMRAEAYLSRPDVFAPGPVWDHGEWVRRHAVLVVEAAAEFMEGFGTEDPARMQARYGMMLMRAATRLRAAASQTPARLRSAAGRDTIEVSGRRRPYSNYFTLEEHDLRFRRFDGSRSAEVTRAALVGADAVTVLPYDPVRDTVLVIEQFRFGPYLRGDPRPWALEPPAGRIDPGETPEAAALRELAEEAGVVPHRLLPLPHYYPSPGAWTEYLYNFVAIAELPDGIAGIAGVAEEAEDIRSHVIGFDAAMALVDSGEAETGPLVMALLWLEHRRSALGTGA